MDSFGIPWWGWLAAFFLVATLAAAWRPGPTAAAWLSAIWSLVKLVVAWSMILALPVLFVLVTYNADWKVGLVVTGLALSLLTAVSVFFVVLNILMRLVDCILRCLDSRP